MILALDKHSALYVFSSPEEAESHLEAIDVQQDEIEFCDERGQRYVPVYTIPPKVSRLGPFGIVRVGAFRLVTEGCIDPGLDERFVERAAHIAHTSIPTIVSIQTLRDELQKRA